MTDADNYAAIYNSIFKDTISSIPQDATNNCIGALNHAQFSIFTGNFVNRLNRLRDYSKKHDLMQDELKKTIRDLALKKGYKWSGPYSELVALDYWSQYEEVTDLKFVVSGDVGSFPDSIARKIGQKTVDLDLSFQIHLSKVFMDVKSFIPTHLELVDKIIEQVENSIGHGKCLIGIDEFNGGNYLEIRKDLAAELQSKNLIKNLITAVESRKYLFTHKCVSGNSYQFRIAYPNKDGGTFLVRTNSHEPYREAFDLRYKPLEYYNKLLINESSLIVFVRNPWFDSDMIGILGNSNEIFYRALSRRVFMELTQNMTRFEELLTCKEISEKITGLVFIEDNSIKAAKDDDLYRSYIYLNPRSTNKKLNRKHFGFLSQSLTTNGPEVIEDFEFDNY